MSKTKSKAKAKASSSANEYTHSAEEMGAFPYKAKEHVEWYTATNGLGRVTLVFDGKTVTIYRISCHLD